jgi:hypothetical protein
MKEAFGWPTTTVHPSQHPRRLAHQPARALRLRQLPAKFHRLTPQKASVSVADILTKSVAAWTRDAARSSRCRDTAARSRADADEAGAWRPGWAQSKRKPSRYITTNEARPFPAESEAVVGCGYLGRSAALHAWATYCSDRGLLNSREAAQIRPKRPLRPEYPLRPTTTAGPFCSINLISFRPTPSCWLR